MTLVLRIVDIAKIVVLAHAILMGVPLRTCTIVQLLVVVRSVPQIALIVQSLDLFDVTLEDAFLASISIFRHISAILVLIIAQLALMLAEDIAILEAVMLSIVTTQQLNFVTQYAVQIAIPARRMGP